MRGRGIVDLQIEAAAATLAQNTASYATGNTLALTGNARWNHSSSRPSRAVQTAREKIRTGIGMEPNIMVVGPAVHDALINNADVIDRVKNVMAANARDIDEALLARYFSVDKYVVGRCRKGAPGAFTALWGKVAILAYANVTPLAAMGSPSWGYTYRVAGIRCRSSPITRSGRARGSTRMFRRICRLSPAPRPASCSPRWSSNASGCPPCRWWMRIMTSAATPAYVTQANLVERFGETELAQLTDTVNRPASVIAGDRVEAACRDASALIDSYLAQRYTLPPGGDMPPVLVRIAGDIALYYLHGSRARDDHPVTMRHRDALAWLRDVARGTVQLEADGPDAAPSQGGAGFSGGRPVFARDRPRGCR